MTPLTPTGLGIALDATGELKWTCPECESTNSIDELDCRVCGNSLFEPLKERTRETRRVPPSRALKSSLVPGGGQWIVGKRGEGIGRFMLCAWLILLAVFVSHPIVRWAQVLFVLAAVAIWAISMLDAAAEARGESPTSLLSGRKPMAVFASSLILVLSLSFVIGVQTVDSNRPETGVVTERTDPGNGAVVRGPDARPQPAAGEPVGNSGSENEPINTSGPEGMS